jgi:AraC family transcriptional regulator
MTVLMPVCDKLELADLYFTSPDRLDGVEQIASRTPGTPGAFVTRYLMNRPNHGLTSPNRIEPAWMAVVHLRPLGAHDHWADGVLVRKPAVATGAFGIYDLRQSLVSDLPEPFHTINFRLPHWMFDQLTNELHAPRIEMLAAPAHIERDEVLFHLSLALIPTLTKPWEASQLFADHVLSAVALHLARHYGSLAPRTKLPKGGLAPWQERRAKEHLLLSLRGDVSLEELAGACGLSGSYFSRAFKQATGMGPHRWLLEQRIAAAKGLLETTTGDLVSIALAAGFADQSHFTRVFSKLVGISPGAWRRLRRS